VKRLVLAGGGHAHLAVLQALARAPREDAEVCLVTPQGHQAYSGMLPGWLAGHYVRGDLEIDLEALSRRANVVLITSRVEVMDADRRCVALSDGRHLEFDLLSLDVGSEIDTSWLETLGDRLMPLRPLNTFLDRWPGALAAARAQAGFRLVVAGAGAAAVEVALAARVALDRERADARVCLVAPSESLLEGHPPGTRRRIVQRLHLAGVELHDGRAVGLSEGLLLADGTELVADRVIAATGAAPPGWLGLSRLRLNEQGYVAVDATHRSVSHRHVFAAGDVCARQDRGFARSGVHAVRAGPILAHNLAAALSGGRLVGVHGQYLPLAHGRGGLPRARPASRAGARHRDRFGRHARLPRR
jgi:NADH dehydrogenase FAD-containing subunit